MLSRHLYVSDMDGTLLASGGNLSEYSANKLAYLLQRGINFTVASARSYTSIKSVFKDIPLTLPVVTHDGAVIYDIAHDKALTFHGMDQGAAENIFSLSEKLNVSPFIECVYNHNEFFMTKRLQNEGMKWLYNFREAAGAKCFVGFDNFSELEKGIISFTYVDEQEVLENLQNEIKFSYGERIKTHLYPKWDCYEWACLTVHDAKAHKGQGLRDLMQHLKYDYSDITVFGDHHNDLAMFMLAQRSVAVANAVPELLALSTHKIGHHNEDSVINFILNENNHYLTSAFDKSEASL